MEDNGYVEAQLTLGKQVLEIVFDLLKVTQKQG